MCYVILSQQNFLYHRMTLTSGFSQKSLNSCDLCHSSNFQTLLHHLIGTIALQSLNNTELSEYVTYKNTIKEAQKKIMIHIFIIPCDVWGCLLPLNYFSALLTKAIFQLRAL